MATSAPPMYTDTPLAVIYTPQYETGETDPFTYEASHTALSHNAFIRGFNSIHQQAPRVPSADRKDFVGYCLAWHECVRSHHQYQEAELFPNVDKAAGKKGLMDAAINEHAAFRDGMDRFKAYLLDRSVNFSGAELVAIMDSFKDPLHSHFKTEPASIMRLAKYNTPETPIDIVAISEAGGNKQLSVGFLFNVLPVYILNMETVEFEDGMWHDVFPPFKGVVKWIMTRAIPMWQSRRWRFVSCSPEGKRKRLAV